MWRWVIAGALLSGAASAADLGEETSSQEALLQEVPGLDKAKEKLDEKKAAEDAKREERLAKLAELNKGKAARVVVLAWEGTDETNETLQRNVKTRIARPDAKFYPDIDLYQVGRREPDRSVRPIDQRGMVPDEAIPAIQMAAEEVSAIPWSDLTEEEWGLKAQELRKLVDEVWFIDRIELREPLFMLYAQIGRAAENMNNNSPPFFEQVGGVPVNYYYFLAGALAAQDPSLLSKISDTDLNDSISYYRQQLDNGGMKMMTLSFKLGETFDPAKFAGEYQVFINGAEVLIDDKDGLYKVPPGRVDIYLARSDGHSISDRIELDKLDDKVYFVRGTARERMGLDFINQLMEHPNECSPELTGDILNYLNIYGKLHLDAEIYVAVPMAGNPNKVGLWRFDRPSGTLQKVLDNTGGFPVRFAGLIGTGMIFGGADTSEFSDPVVETDPETGLPIPPTPPDPSELVTPAPDSLPFSAELRGHFGRLLVLIGGHQAVSLGGGFADRYPTGSNTTVTDNATGAEVLNEPTVRRLVYLGVGGVLGKEAANGFGPLGYVRVGYSNVPISIVTTAHGGITLELPVSKGEGRIRAIAHAGGFGGVMIPVGNSLLRGTVLPSFGLEATAGLTF